MPGPHSSQSFFNFPFVSCGSTFLQSKFQSIPLQMLYKLLIFVARSVHKCSSNYLVDSDMVIVSVTAGITPVLACLALHCAGIIVVDFTCPYGPHLILPALGLVCTVPGWNCTIQGLFLALHCAGNVVGTAQILVCIVHGWDCTLTGLFLGSTALCWHHTGAGTVFGYFLLMDVDLLMMTGTAFQFPYPVPLPSVYSLFCYLIEQF